VAKLINISEAASLAIHSMVIIACSNELLNAAQIADFTGVSRNHLAKVLQTLVRYNFLVSHRGPKGGFELSRSASSINLKEIYELMEGQIQKGNCGLHGTPCPFEECVFGGLTRRFITDFSEYLENKTLADINFKKLPKNEKNDHQH
jgi:Rrf2 family protein